MTADAGTVPRPPQADEADIVTAALARAPSPSKAARLRASAVENAEARRITTSVRRMPEAPDAIEQLLRLVVAHPADERMQVYVGRVLNQVQDRRALAVWRGIHHRFPMSKDAFLHGLRWTMRLHGLEAAWAGFEAEFKTEPGDPAALILYGRGLLEFGRLDDAQKVFAAVANAGDATEQLLLELAQLYVSLGQLSRAQQVAELAIGRFGGTAPLTAVLDKVAEAGRRLQAVMPAGAAPGEDAGNAVLAQAFKVASDLGSKWRHRPDHAFLGPVVMINGSLGFGGAERQFTRTALALHAAATSGEAIDGHDIVGPVHVVCRSLESRSGADFFAPELRRAGLCIHEYETLGEYGGRPRYSVARPLFPFLEALPPQMREGLVRLADLLRFLEADIVHIWQDGSVLATALAALAAGTPRIVLGVRTLPPPDRMERAKPEYLTMYRALTAEPSVRMVANSRLVAARYEAWLDIPHGEIRVIPNGIGLPDSTADQATAARFWAFSAATPGGSLTVGSVMRFDENKRPLLWLDVAAALVARQDNARFILVGDGPLLPQAIARAEELGLSQRVLFVGRSNEVGYWLTHMDVFLLLSRHEGLPNVLIEAQVAGVPVVTTPAGGAPEAIEHGSTGTVLTDDPALGLEQVVGAILAWSREPEARRALGDMIAAAAQERFSLERMIGSTVDAYLGGRVRER